MNARSSLRVLKEVLEIRTAQTVLRQGEQAARAKTLAEHDTRVRELSAEQADREAAWASAPDLYIARLRGEALLRGDAHLAAAEEMRQDADGALEESRARLAQAEARRCAAEQLLDGLRRTCARRDEERRLARLEDQALQARGRR